MTVPLTKEMVAAGKAALEANALRFWNSAKGEAEWLWLLSLVYSAMREKEPKPSDKPKKKK